LTHRTELLVANQDSDSIYALPLDREGIFPPEGDTIPDGATPDRRHPLGPSCGPPRLLFEVPTPVCIAVPPEATLDASVLLTHL
jgi:hypothetical protein